MTPRALRHFAWCVSDDARNRPISVNDCGPVRQLARFIPVRGQNLNSPLIGTAAVAGAPFPAVALLSQAPTLPLPVGTPIELRDAGGARYDVLVSGHGRTRFRAGSDAPVTTHDPWCCTL